MRIGILQPSYLPWLGFFDQMAKSDVFILYDNTQYDKNGWRNRNRIKTANGVQWLTVPVLTKGQNKPLVKDILIDNHIHWRETHLKSIQQNYSRAPFFKDYFDLFRSIYSSAWERLIDLDLVFILELRQVLGVHSALKFASTFDNYKDEGRDEGRVEHLIKICEALGADEFIEGNAGKEYLEGAGEQAFADSGIKLIYHDYQHPTYKQLYGEFVPFLSVLDLLFNCGKDSLDILTGKIPTSKKEALA